MFQTEEDKLKEARDRIALKRTQIENEAYFQELIADLEAIQKEWQEILQELKIKQEQYNVLIENTKHIKQIIVDDALHSNISKSSKHKIRILSRDKKR